MCFQTDGIFPTELRSLEETRLLKFCRLTKCYAHLFFIVCRKELQESNFLKGERFVYCLQIVFVALDHYRKAKIYFYIFKYHLVTCNIFYCYIIYYIISWDTCIAEYFNVNGGLHIYMFHMQRCIHYTYGYIYIDIYIYIYAFCIVVTSHQQFSTRIALIRSRVLARNAFRRCCVRADVFSNVGSLFSWFCSCLWRANRARTRRK